MGVGVAFSFSEGEVPKKIQIICPSPLLSYFFHTFELQCSRTLVKHFSCFYPLTRSHFVRRYRWFCQRSPLNIVLHCWLQIHLWALANKANPSLAQTNWDERRPLIPGRPEWLQHFSSIVFSWGFLWVASLQATTETARAGFTRDLRAAKLALRKKLSAKPNKRLFSESLRAAALQLLWYRMTKSSNFRAFVLCARRLLGPPCAVTSHRRWLYIEAATAHIPSDHSCVWHFKEDYENEMW